MFSSIRKDRYRLPGDRSGEIDVVFLGRGYDLASIPNELRYLHTLRSGSLRRIASSIPGSRDAFDYYKNLSGFLPPIREWSLMNQFPLAVMAPSSRHDAEPYFSAVFQPQRDCEDLSPFFRKLPGFHAGKAKSVEEATNGIQCSLLGRVYGADRLLIVDDVLAHGFTAAAVIHHLRDSLAITPDAAVTLLVPLWIADPPPAVGRVEHPADKLL